MSIDKALHYSNCFQSICLIKFPFRGLLIVAECSHIIHLFGPWVIWKKLQIGLEIIFRANVILLIVSAVSHFIVNIFKLLTRLIVRNYILEKLVCVVIFFADVVFFSHSKLILRVLVLKDLTNTVTPGKYDHYGNENN